MARIYFAGPLFTHAERRWNRELAAALEHAGHAVWLPQEKAGLAIEAAVPSPRAIFDSAIAGITQAEIVLAVVDGADPDSGTSFECGYAHAVGTPIVAVRTDFRGGGDDPDASVNLMLSQAAAAVVLSAHPTPAGDDVAAVALAIVDALGALQD